MLPGHRSHHLSVFIIADIDRPVNTDPAMNWLGSNKTKQLCSCAFCFLSLFCNFCQFAKQKCVFG